MAATAIIPSAAPFEHSSNREGVYHSRSLSIISDSDASIASIETVDTASEADVITPPSSPPLLPSASFSPFVDPSEAPAPPTRRTGSRSQTRDYFTLTLSLNPSAAPANEDVKTPGIHSATAKSTPVCTPSALEHARSPFAPMTNTVPEAVLSPHSIESTPGWTFLSAETLADRSSDVSRSSSDGRLLASNAAVSPARLSLPASPAVMVESRSLSRPVSMPSLPCTPSLSPFLSPSAFPAPPPRALPSSAPPRPRSHPPAFSGALSGDPTVPHHYGPAPSSPPALPIAQRRRAPTNASATLAELDANSGFRLNLGSLPPVFAKMGEGAAGPSRGRASERAIGLGIDKEVMNKTAATSAQVMAGKTAAPSSSSRTQPASSARPRYSPSTSRRGSSASSGLGHGLRQWPGLGWGRRGSGSSGGAQYAVATPSANGGMMSRWSPDSGISDDEYSDDSDEGDVGDEAGEDQATDEKGANAQPTITVQHISPPSHTSMRKSLSADTPSPVSSPTRSSRTNSPRSISLPSRPQYTRSWTSSPRLPPHQVGSHLSPVPASPLPTTTSLSSPSSSDSDLAGPASAFQGRAPTTPPPRPTFVRMVTTPAEMLADARSRLLRQTGVAVGMTRSASANSATPSPYDKWAWSAGSGSDSGDGYLVGKTAEVTLPVDYSSKTVRREVNPYFPVL